MINKTAADRSILLMFDTEFEHVTPNQQHTFKVTGSEVKITT